MRRFLLAFSLLVVPSLFGGARPLTPDPPVEPTYGAPQEASVAASRDQFLAVWNEFERVDPSLYAAFAFASRVTSSGKVLDPEGIPVGAVDGWSSPRAASDGERFLVAGRHDYGAPDLELAVVDRDGIVVHRQRIRGVASDVEAVLWDGTRYVVVTSLSGWLRLIFVDRDGRPAGGPLGIGERHAIAVAAVDGRYVFLRHDKGFEYTIVNAAGFSGLDDQTAWTPFAAAPRADGLHVVAGLHSFLIAASTRGSTPGDAYLQAFAVDEASAPRPLTPVVHLSARLASLSDRVGGAAIAAVGSRFVVAAPAGATVEPEPESAAIELHAGVAADDLAESNGSVLAVSVVQLPLARFDHRTIIGTVFRPRKLVPAGEPFAISTATPAQELVGLTTLGGHSIAVSIQRGARDHLLLTDVGSGATAEVPTNGSITMRDPADATAVSDGKALLVYWNERRPGEYYPAPRVAFVSSDLQVRTSFDTQRDDCNAEAVLADAGTFGLVCHPRNSVILQRYDGTGLRLGTEQLFEDLGENVTVERVARNGSMWVAGTRWASIGIPEASFSNEAVVAPVSGSRSGNTLTHLPGKRSEYTPLFAEAASNGQGAVAANGASAAFFRPGASQPFRTFEWRGPWTRGHVTAFGDGFFVTAGASVTRFDNNGNVYGARLLPGDVATSIANPKWVLWQTPDTPASRGRIFIDEYAQPPRRRGVTP